MLRFLVAASVLTIATALHVAPSSAALSLSNDPGDGNGFVSGVSPTGFTLTGTDFLDGPGLGFPYTTMYTDIAAGNITVTFDWEYTSVDTPGFDYTGFIIDGEFTLLANAANSNTSEAFVVTAGQTYGWFVNTLEAGFGPGVLTVSNIELAEVPEPISTVLLGSAVGLLGLARRRNRPSQV